MTTPQRISDTGRSATLYTRDGKAVHVRINGDDATVVVSGELDSLLIPIEGLMTHPDDTGYIGTQVANNYNQQIADRDADHNTPRPDQR